MENKHKKIKAFTMAEAILVMAILGVIAAVMISTIKPAEYKKKGLTLLGNKVLSELDIATAQIMVNGGKLGYMNSLGNGHAFDNATYQKYLSKSRKAVASYCPSSYNGFVLKDGACVQVKTSTTSTKTCYPGEAAGANTTPVVGLIYFDVNGNDEPNTLCEDQFIVPVNANGIEL